MNEAEGVTDETLSEESGLVRRLQNGDGAAFEEMVRIYGPRMLAVIQRYLPIAEDAQDVLQDAFISAFRAIDRFQSQSRLGTWLFRIAVNAALMKLRSRARRPEKAIEDLLPRFTSDGHREITKEWAVTHDTEAEDADSRRAVREAINELPETYRIILLLRDIEERSTEETAEVLELTVANVKTRLHRARQALREILEQRFGSAI